MKLLLVFACCVVGALAKPKPISELAKEYAAKHPNTDRDNPEYGDLFEGDIILRSVDDQNVQTDSGKVWPGGILYYEIQDSDYSNGQIDLILAGINDLVNSVNDGHAGCLTIQPRNGESNYVRVLKGGGCSSFVGMSGGMQTLSLEDGCVSRHGTIMHEFLHAIGFYHEHTRTDRDNWVTVNFDNIEEDKKHNFDKKEASEIDQLGTAYDYGGVMHYGAYAFAIDDNVPTIIPIPDSDVPIGQRTHLSELDKERVRLHYECVPSE